MHLRSTLTAGAVWLAACAPALDWREVRPDGSGALALFPCRPSSHARTVQLADGPVNLTLYACSAGNVTWALAFADVRAPQRVGQALSELRESALANISATSGAPLALKVEGSTPNVLAGRIAIDGRLPDGKPVREQVAHYVRGTVVFQVTALGERLDGEAVDTFFSSLRFPT